MGKYVVKRILYTIPILIIVSIIVFSLLHLIPGDAASTILGDEATAEEVEALREEMGLNKPLIGQYFDWVNNICHGDFGISVASNSEPVADMITSHFKPTIELAVFALLISVIVALPLGMLAARKKGTVADHTVSIIGLLGISLPSFLVGIGLMMLFAVKLKWFPSSGYKAWSDGALAHIRSLTLPAISLGFMHAAFMMRMTRASMLEVLGSDYVRMAKAKGVSSVVIVSKHAFRNCLVTVITVIGQAFIGALSGAAITETLFGIPGIGSLVVNSIGRRDYQVIQAAVLLIAVINVVINLVVDLLYGFVDPRVKVE